MASDQQMFEALKKAAEALLGRALSPKEEADLKHSFNNATGTSQQRAIKALVDITRLDESVIGQKRAASNDVDRKMDDLRGKLEQWKRGS